MRSAERRLKAARFPAHKTLDEFDFAARPSVNKPQMLELVKGEYLDHRENVLFVGTSRDGQDAPGHRAGHGRLRSRDARSASGESPS